MESPAPQPSPPAPLAPGEITAVLPEFGLGTVRSVRAYPRGNPHAPKALVEADRGRFLLKRRPESSGDLDRVQREHAVQAELRRAGVPVALPEHDGPTAIDVEGLVPELMRYVEGEPVRIRPATARVAGQTLARVHAVPAGAFGFAGPALPPPDRIEAAIGRLKSATPTLRVPLESMQHDWLVSLDRVERDNPAKADTVLIHGDYHPANLLWREDELAAVVDFEATGLGPRAGELAAGALLFALDTPGDSPRAWAESPDVARLAAFTAGYAQTAAGAPGPRSPESEPSALPWWMIHGLVAQAVRRAGVTGGFGRHSPAEIIPFVAHASAWIRDHADGLTLILADELASGHRPPS